MTELPINFTGQEVLAVLDWRKTQHRIVVRRRDAADPGALPLDYRDGMFWFADGDAMPIPYPYEVGDLLWVRETWHPAGRLGTEYLVEYAADKSERTVDAGWEGPTQATDKFIRTRGWRPSVHMPRWASRITLDVTEVRVQRVREIGMDGAHAEGIEADGGDDETRNRSTLENYALRWNARYAKRGLGWEANPWVWAITFRRVEP